MYKFSLLLEEIVRAHPSTITALVRKIGMSRPSFYALLDGTNLPRESRLECIFEALGLSPGERGKLHHLYKADKLSPQRGRRRVAPFQNSFLTEIKEALEKNNLNPTSPFRDGPDFYLEHDNLKIGLEAKTQVLDWDSALGEGLRMADTHDLARIVIIIKEKPADLEKLGRLFAKHNLEIVPVEALADWKPLANGGK
jgi:hypothetical protein